MWQGWLSGLWFIPTIMVVSAIFLALLLIELDSRLTWAFLENLPRLFGAGADGSRGMLTAIAGSVITVASLTFSLTITALAQASSQYTSRVLRNFIHNRTNQVVLGFFVGLFSYCLVVLRTIRGGDEGTFVPSLSVFVGLLLAIVGTGVLIYFIHHIASSLQASTIIASAFDETSKAVEHLFPQELGDEASESETQTAKNLLAGQPQHQVLAQTTGYIQSVDVDGLLECAERHEMIVVMERAIGQFVVRGTPLVSVADELTAVDPELQTKINKLFTVKRSRTVEQDAGFGIRQLVDVALKALSPGVNDTTTAIMCVDYLGALLAQLARRKIESPFRVDRKNAKQVRVITKGSTFRGLVTQAFDQIRDAAKDNTAVYLRLLTAFQTVASQTHDARRLEVLREQTYLVAECTKRTVTDPYNRALVEERLEQTLRLLDANSHALPTNDV
jgi:uncharacterized membrane protein